MPAPERPNNQRWGSGRLATQCAGGGESFQRGRKVNPAGGCSGKRQATWPDREEGLVEALDGLLATQRSLGLPTPERATEPFWDRPFRTVSPDVARLLLDDVSDPAVRALPEGVGAVEQWADSVAVLGPAHRRLSMARTVLGGAASP